MLAGSDDCLGFIGFRSGCPTQGRAPWSPQRFPDPLKGKQIRRLIDFSWGGVFRDLFELRLLSNAPLCEDVGVTI